MRYIILILSTFSTFFSTAQSVHKSLDRLVLFYDKEDMHEVAQTAKSLGFELIFNLEPYQSNGVYFSNKLMFEKKIGVDEDGQALINRISFEKTVKNGIKTEELTDEYIERKKVELLEVYSLEDNFYRHYKSQTNEEISIKEFVWDITSPNIYGNEEISVDNIELEIHDYQHYKNLNLVFEKYVSTLSDLFHNRNTLSHQCYIENPEVTDFGNLGTIRTHNYFYRNDPKCDSSINTSVNILSSFNVSYMALGDNSKRDIYDYVPLVITLNIRKNRFFDNKDFQRHKIKMLKKKDGTYDIPVIINGEVESTFTFDTGASEVFISKNLAAQLFKTGTLTENQFLGNSKFVMANGNEESLKRYLLNSIQVGNKEINNVICAVSNNQKSTMLLGQSFLSRLGSFEFDYQKELLILKN